MACTTLLVGKAASYDGSTIMARNEDCPNGEFHTKKIIVTEPEDQPRHYKALVSHVEMDLPDDPLRYTSTPDVTKSHGIWGEAGINSANVAMSATETITTNERVLGADPYVELQKAVGKPGDADYQPEVAGGIGEEDLITIVLPYIHSAREGVTRLGALLEKYGTYEPNAIGFADADEIWWLETIGGHHWMARRVPDDCYVTMPNQLGIDEFDLDDAFGEQKEYMCSADLREFMADNFLNLSVDGDDTHFNPRDAFGSHSDSDHVYNTPRAWWMQRYLNPYDEMWDGPEADHTPESDDIPWCRQPEHKVTLEDVRYVLAGHYQGTPFDPYGHDGTPESRKKYRPIGINRTSELSILQIRPYMPEANRAIQWLSFGSGPFNAMVPLFTNVDSMPQYVSGTTDTVTSENLYWADRLIAALADAHYAENSTSIERYDEKVISYGHSAVIAADKAVAASSFDSSTTADKGIRELLAKSNEELVAKVQKDTTALLGEVLYTTSMEMKNGFFLSDN